MKLSPATPSDRALLDAWIAGQDEAALGALMQRHRPMLVALARRVLRDPAGAEDVAQEVFTRLSEDAAGISGPVDAWLRTATGNLAISHLRSRLRRRRREAEAVLPDHDQGDHLEDAEQRLQVNESVAALTPAEQDLIIRVFWLGHTMETIAREQRVSRVAISKRVHRSMERMRSRLHRRGVRLGLAALATALLGGSGATAEIAALVGASATTIAIAGLVGMGALAAVAVAAVHLVRGAPATDPQPARTEAQADPSPAAPVAARPEAQGRPPAAGTAGDSAPPPCWLRPVAGTWTGPDPRDWVFAGAEIPADAAAAIEAGAIAMPPLRGQIGRLTLGSPEVSLAMGAEGPLLRLEALPTYVVVASPPTPPGALDRGMQVLLTSRLFSNDHPPRGPQLRQAHDRRWHTYLQTMVLTGTGQDQRMGVTATSTVGDEEPLVDSRLNPVAQTWQQIPYLKNRFTLVLASPVEFGTVRMRLLEPGERAALLAHLAERERRQPASGF